MNKKGLKVLEYSKIIDMLRARACSAMAKARIDKLMPMTDIHEIRDALLQTSESASVIMQKGSLPLGDFYDINDSLYFARKGGSLTMKQLLQVLYNMKVTGNVVTFLNSDVTNVPMIMSMKDLLVTFPRLAERIDRSILSEDEMADSASPELKRIRKAINSQNDAIKAKLNHILGSSDNKTFLQDAIVTMRDGRYVVPVKAEHRAKMPGIIHDQSSSGATIFIEPQAVVNLNNELRELELEEKKEIERILAELSSQVAEHFHDLINNQKLLVELDFYFAKGKLSCDMRAAEPQMNESGYLELKRARHPLIDPKKVVPINISIGKEYNTLVITGPNTGGKTVTLKTVGLLAMMAQAGLHIPALGTSSLPIYSEIFADIGDEQSIEQSLSTFSSHMKNTVYLVERAHKGSLVLLDELGAGTDPTEGAALAISILERLAAQGSHTIATTHYNELKKYALSTAGVENASMEFDVETLSPTYRLYIGVAGKSNAFEISRKLGLDSAIIDRASQLIEKGDMAFEDVLSAIEDDKRKAQAEREEAERLIAELKAEKEDLDSREQNLKGREDKLLKDAREEARAIIKEAKETATEVQKELKQLTKVKSLGERTKRLEESKRKIRESEKRYQDGIERPVNLNPVKPDEIEIGDRVKLLTLNQNGQVASLPDAKGDLLVTIGIMKVTANVADLMSIEGGSKKKAKKSSYAGLYKSKAQNISMSVNVQGENLEDALMNVDKYIDDAYMAGLKEVMIIHGHGTGVLKEGIRRSLNKHKLVASYKRGAYNEGGDGVTIVKLKE